MRQIGLGFLSIVIFLVALPLNEILDRLTTVGIF